MCVCMYVCVCSLLGLAELEGRVGIQGQQRVYDPAAACRAVLRHAADGALGTIP